MNLSDPTLRSVPYSDLRYVWYLYHSLEKTYFPMEHPPVNTNSEYYQGYDGEYHYDRFMIGRYIEYRIREVYRTINKVRKKRNLPLVKNGAGLTECIAGL